MLKFDVLANVISGLFGITTKNKSVFEIPSDFLLMFDLQVEFQQWPDKSERNERVHQLASRLILAFNDINESIGSLNRNLVLLNSDFSLVRVKKIPIQKALLEKRLDQVFHDVRVSKGLSSIITPHIKSSLTLLLRSYVDRVAEDCKKVVEVISPRGNPLVKNLNVPPAYLQQTNEVLDLFYLGYKSTSLLVLGKLFEGILTRYIIRLVQSNKINLNMSALREMTFDNKLGLLFSKGFVTRKDYLILAKLIWDRNIGGHFVSERKRRESEKEAEATIKLVMPLLKKYDTKLK